MDNFVCLQCIEAEIVERDRKRRESFEKEQEQAETELGYPLAIRQREFRLKSQWLQDEQKDVDDLVDAGRPCFPVYEQVHISLPGQDEDVERHQGLQAHENDTIQQPAERNGDEERPTPDFVERYYGEYEVAFATQVPILTGAKEVHIEPRSAWSSSSEENATAGDSGSDNAGTETASEKMTALPPRASSSSDSAGAGDLGCNNAGADTASEDMTALPSRTSSSTDSAAVGELGASGVGDDTASENVTALPSASKPKKLQKERKVSARFWKKAHKDIHKWF